MQENDDQNPEKDENGSAEDDTTQEAQTPVKGAEDEKAAQEPKKGPGFLRKTFDALASIGDKIPEGSIGGHWIPGWVAANKAMSAFIAVVIIAPLTLIGLGVAHSVWNASYTDDYEALLDDIANESARTCLIDGEPDKDRTIKTYKTIMSDVKDSGDTSSFFLITSTLNLLPFIGDWFSEFEVLPNAKVYKALSVADEHNIQFYPGDGFKKDVRAVIFNDGVKAPTLVYDELDNGELKFLMNEVSENGLNKGILSISWNEASEKFETERADIDAQEIPVLGGLDSAPVPINSCYHEDTFFGGLFGGDDDEAEEEALEIEEELEEEGPSLWQRVWGSDDEEQSEDSVEETLEQPLEEQESQEEEKAELEDDEPGFLDNLKTGWGTWGGDDEDTEQEQTENEQSAPAAPAPAPN